MSKSKIAPVGDRILIQFAKGKEQVRDGIILPDVAGERPQEATVISLGTGSRRKDGTIAAFEVKIGETVLVAKYAGAEIRLKDQNYTLVREDDILGVLA